MPKFIGKITRDEASDFKLVPAEDVDIRGANDLTNITLSDDDYIIVDDASIFTGIDSGTEDSTGKVTLGQLKTYIGAGLTTEQVQDIVGAMFSSNTETRITATYQDGDGTIDLAVDDMTADTNTNQLTTFTIRDDDDDDSTVAQGKFVKFTKGIGANGVNITGSGTTSDPFIVAISSPAIPGIGDGGLTTNDFTDADHTKLNGIESNAEVNVQSDWNSSSGDSQILNKPTIPVDLTVDGAGTVHANNYTNTTYSEATSSDAGLMSTDHHDKLDGIEASADVTDTTNVTASGALMDSELTDLAGVKGVTISTLQVKPSEGAFADGDKTKLDGIEASADVTDTTNVTSAGALMDSELTDLAGVKGVTISTLQVKPSEGAFVNGDKTKLDGIEASADVTDTANVTSAGALMDSELTDLAGVKGVTISTLQVKPSEGAFADGDKTKLDGIEASADVTDATNVTAAGALMDSELTDLAGVKGVTISTLQVKPSEGAFVNGDKTKLDGIETSADVTDATNVAAAGALMDSEVTNLADVKAFDTSDYATSAQGTLATNALPKSGGTMTGALTMSSGDKLQFVDANEFLSSDGTDLTIGSGNNVKINPAGGQVIIEDDDGAEPILAIKSTADSQGAGGINFNKDRGSAGTDNDNIGIINWYGKSSDNGDHIFAQIYGVCTESDASNEEGRIKLNVTTSHSSLGSITTTGLQLDGTTTDGQIDVAVGAGTGSTTAVAGNLTVAGDISGAAVGIGDNKLLAVDDADAADDDYAKFTANGLEGRSAAEVKTDLSLNNVSNDAQMPLSGGIFTGAVTMGGDPTNNLHVATKQYVDNSVYPGQILGYTYNHPSSLTYHLLTTTMTVEANTHFVTFDTPPSEKVEIEVSAMFDRVSTSDVGVYMGLSDNATYNSMGDEWAYDFNQGIGNSDDEADDTYITTKFVVQAAELAAIGASNTFYIGLGSTDASAVYLRYGYAGGRTYPPMIIKATALPSSINEE